MRLNLFMSVLVFALLLVGCPPGDDDDDTSGDDDVGDDDTSGDDDAGLTDCLYYRDADGDGYGSPGDEMLWSCDGPPEGYVDNNEDCDDDDPDIYPGAEELCDGLDNDCDGAEDEDLPLYECHTDGDGDGYGEIGGMVAMQCECGPGSSPEGTDCDDSTADVYPGAPDVCDDVLDNDCDGATDPGEEDDDSDGYSECQGDCDDTDASLNLDDLDADGMDTCSGDCDDEDETSYPGAAEVCDGLDNNCDGTPDDGLAFDTYYPDVDQDLYGDLTSAGDYTCAPQSGWVLDNTDCDDADSTAYPGATELCDALDNDCDGAPDATEVDADADGYLVCDGDCDDGDPLTRPGAEPHCGSLDADCDGVADVPFPDDDGDGYSTCDDCDDANPDVHPGAAEVCDGVPDNDCDGVLHPQETDDDGDGDSECEGDCDDSNAAINPMATDIVGDGFDQNCDGVDGCGAPRTYSRLNASRATN